MAMERWDSGCLRCGSRVNHNSKDDCIKHLKDTVWMLERRLSGQTTHEDALKDRAAEEQYLIRQALKHGEGEG